MNPIQIILHLGSLIKAAEDADHVVNDILHHDPVGNDMAQTLADIATLIAAGFFQFPIAVPGLPGGLTQDMAIGAVKELSALISK